MQILKIYHRIKYNYICFSQIADTVVVHLDTVLIDAKMVIYSKGRRNCLCKLCFENQHAVVFDNSLFT